MHPKFETFILRQVYEFIKEKGEEGKLDQLSLILNYFSELHIGAKDNFSFEKPCKIKGNFGDVRCISIASAPDFHKKDLFIAWVESMLIRLKKLP